MDYCKIRHQSAEHELQATKYDQLKAAIISHKRSLLLILSALLVLCLVLLTLSFIIDIDTKEEFKPFKGVSVKIKHSEDATDIKVKFESKNFAMEHKIKRNKEDHKFFNFFSPKNHKKIDFRIDQTTGIKKSHHHNQQPVQCFNVNVSMVAEDPMIGCFDLGNNSWYGGHESYGEPFWPLNNQTFDYKAYITGYPDIWGALLERYWLSSSGLAIFIDESIPLFVKNLNHKQICLMSDRNQSPYSSTPGVFQNNKLSYNVCIGPDIKTVHLYMIENFLGKPTFAPDPLMIQAPVWTTWSYYFRDINQSVVLDYAQQIAANNYPRSQLEIDDQWESLYGDLDFDKSKFPEMKSLSTSLKKLGFRVTLWVHPFCNIDSKNFVYGANQGYWVKDPTGKFPAFTSWWNGKYAAILDTTNPNATDYFVAKLKALKDQYGVDGFKFDAGESAWTPQQFKLSDAKANPNVYSDKYVRMAARMGNFIEVRTGARSQDVGVFYRILDRSTDWGINDGLKSVITETLAFGIRGYPYVLPDIIFGNDGPDKSKKELYIRWTQLTAFMPAMQFSTPPWYFDEQTNKICRDMVRIHQQLAPYIIQLAQKLDGVPIVRPMWWANSTEPATFTMTDQFMLGDQVVVAPVLDPGFKMRNIFLPNGKWFDANLNVTITGPKWFNYAVAIETTPYFVLQNSYVYSLLFKV